MTESSLISDRKSLLPLFGKQCSTNDCTELQVSTERSKMFHAESRRHAVPAPRTVVSFEFIWSNCSTENMVLKFLKNVSQEQPG